MREKKRPAFVGGAFSLFVENWPPERVFEKM